MQLREWRPFVKNKPRGFAVIELPNGLVTRDISVHQKNGREWASLPSKPQLDQKRRQKIGTDGKPAYVLLLLLQWNNRDLSDRFSAALQAGTRRRAPARRRRIMSVAELLRTAEESERDQLLTCARP